MSWVLHDKEELKGTLRHEFAHYLVNLKNKLAPFHGRLFNDCLRLVSGRRWREDKHVKLTLLLQEAIDNTTRGQIAKRRAETRAIRKKVICCACGYRYSFKSVPSYIRRGLFICPSCKRKGATFHIQYWEKSRLVSEVKIKELV